MTDSINWTLFHSFLAVMQQGSLSGAARQLGATQPTIGRHITELEKALGVSLFVRSQSGFIATDIAHALVPHATEMASMAASMERVAKRQGEGVQGTVRISASEVIGVEVLPSILASLRREHPQLVIELVVSDESHDLLHREADIAVRMFRPKQTQLITRCVGNIALGFFAHKEYVAQHGMPQVMDDLLQHTLVGFDTLTDYIRGYAPLFSLPLTRELFKYRTDNTVAQLAMIRSGVGIGVCQVSLVENDPNIDQLFLGQSAFELEVWMTMHEDLKRSPACKAVFDILSRGMEEYVQRQNTFHL